MAALSGRKVSWLYVVWIIVGIVLAWTHSYVTVSIIKVVVSALLSIVLWPLVLLGVSLHIH
ncbi:MAG: hypothetical protein J2P28_01290 [Actinobacteria bacterium]|nr:hypothetical protein [Actinomycetota bacterium]